mmetsp:Transcript_126991/g.301611  ORF Transcript_126991/g.301611 Transcript_126991/m.301611 type:complete len:270 (-) Transcript_126991:3326-4135(-)
MSNSKLLSTGFEVALHVSISNDHKLGVTPCAQNHGNGLQEQIRTLLDCQAAHEKEHGIHHVEALVALGVARPLILPLHLGNGVCVDAVVDDLNFGSMDLVVVAHLLLQNSRHRNNTLRRMACMPLDSTDSCALSSILNVATAASFGGVHGEDNPLVHGGKLDDGWSNQPVVAVDHVKATYLTFDMQEVPHEGGAHVLDLSHKVAVCVEVHLMVDDAHNLVLPRAIVGGSSENVHSVANLVQRSSQLCNVRSNTSSCNGVQGLPREHRNL